MLFEEITIHTPYLNFAAKRWGDVGGPPILALHGWLDNSGTFDTLAPYLKNYHLVALDLAGHGRSGHRPAGMKYHYMDYVDDITAVVDALGWDRFHLLGHSLGGGISTIFAGTFPDRVASLSLIEAMGPKTYPIEKAPEFLAMSINQMKRQNGKKTRYSSLEEMVTARTKVSGLSFESARYIIERSAEPCEGGYTWRSDSRLKIKSPSYATEEQIQTFLSAIAAKVLLIKGTMGSIVTREELSYRATKIADLRQAVVEGGHHLHLDSPEKTSEMILSFLEQF